MGSETRRQGLVKAIICGSNNHMLISGALAILHYLSELNYYYGIDKSCPLQPTKLASKVYGIAGFQLCTVSRCTLSALP